MTTEAKPSGMNTDQFLALAKSAHGAALAALMVQVLEAPGIYVFGEFLDLPNVKELANGPHASVHCLLNIFAYGTYTDYLANLESLPPLNNVQKNKLRHLSIVSLAAKRKCIPTQCC
nr:PREDICTED: COP9 signalosome complex subunit 7a-like [Latimeria chalumnae]|eukprot:XP_006014589.2 PREDICTED: COP9 signalosome complex subunit 7a-like [Latimeria chalumnae]